jgi:AcrR family transcriptional regulator
MMRTMRRRRPIALTRSELYQRVWAQPLGTVAKELGVSGNALAKICNRLLVPYPSRGYWPKLNVGKAPPRPPLPAAPEAQSRRLTISGQRARSRRVRTRLPPPQRRDQLMEVAAQIVRSEGIHAASMKRIAAAAGISESLAYTYFPSRERLLAELAQQELTRIRAIRDVERAQGTDHFARVRLSTSSYLRQTALRGGLLQLLLRNPDIRAMVREQQGDREVMGMRAHAQRLVDMYGIPQPVALGCTVVLTRVCGRAGQIIADRRLSLEATERLCLAIVLRGSRDILDAEDSAVGRPQPVEAA